MMSCRALRIIPGRAVAVKLQTSGAPRPYPVKLPKAQNLSENQGGLLMPRRDGVGR